MQNYFPYNIESTQGVSETLTISGGQVQLRNIPRQGSVTISGFIETTSLVVDAGKFRVDYFDANGEYREASRKIYFNSADNGKTVSVGYSPVGTPVTAADMNEIKAHMENSTLHGGGGLTELPIAAVGRLGCIKPGYGLYAAQDGTLSVSGVDADINYDDLRNWFIYDSGLFGNTNPDLTEGYHYKQIWGPFNDEFSEEQTPDWFWRRDNEGLTWIMLPSFFDESEPYFKLYGGATGEPLTLANYEFTYYQFSTQHSGARPQINIDVDDITSPICRKIGYKGTQVQVTEASPQYYLAVAEASLIIVWKVNEWNYLIPPNMW